MADAILGAPSSEPQMRKTSSPIGLEYHLSSGSDTQGASPPNYRGYSLRQTPDRLQRQSDECSSSDFELLADGTPPLGSGGYGTVVRARHTPTGELVAAKVVPAARGVSREALRAEFAMLTRFAHAHVVIAKGFEESAAATTIFTELCTTDLFALTRKRGQLPVDEAKRYFTQLMGAVKHLHSYGVCHRDLKLENCLLDLNGVCKLCDFGLAHVLASHETTGDRWLTEICGSRSYCAPEVCACVCMHNHSISPLRSRNVSHHPLRSPCHTRFSRAAVTTPTPPTSGRAASACLRCLPGSSPLTRPPTRTGGTSG